MYSGISILLFFTHIIIIIIFSYICYGVAVVKHSDSTISASPWSLGAVADNYSLSGVSNFSGKEQVTLAPDPLSDVKLPCQEPRVPNLRPTKQNKTKLRCKQKNISDSGHNSLVQYAVIFLCRNALYS